MEIKIKQVTHEDLDTIMELQKSAYVEELLEKKEAYEKMLAAYPDGFKILLVDGRPAGYVFYHPGFEDQIQPLDETSLKITGEEDCMYLHDMVVHPDFRGKKLTRPLFECFDQATKEKGFTKQALVAVQDSFRFWQKYGFTVAKEIEYGGLPAYYMKREVKN
jgi:GNAT superfamily N-acetyltransferase